MKINFSKKILENQHLVLVLFDYKSIFNSKLLDNDLKSNIKTILREKKSGKSSDFIESFYHGGQSNLKSVTIVSSKIFDKKFKYENLAGNILTHLEKKDVVKFSLIVEEVKAKIDYQAIVCGLASGFCLKNYRFEKYKTISKKDNLITSINFVSESNSLNTKKILSSINSLKGVFLTRDLVSEPANVLYPEKFVAMSKTLEKVGVKIEIFDERKIKSLGMNALMGVALGSSRPPRVMIMKWAGKKNKKFVNPLAFVGKGVTFDTGGISIKPSSGMEDMKWDMGGAAVVTGLMYTLALRKSNVNAIGIVGLVENMPDGNAQRPGDIVKSLSGQTIEVLNTDAEGRLVLADILWYIKEKYKPKFMIDLATLTGAIIVALGDRYAGLFSNNDDLAKKIVEASYETGELSWRLPMDSQFDKLLNCKVADMKNITGTRGAGSITAAQFLKRFVGDTNWAHLDIAGVTWSNKGTQFSRPGGTGFGVRLLDFFVKKNYE